MWVSASNYEFLTIRQNARMTLIRPSYNVATDTLTVTAPAPNAIDEKLEFSIPAHPSAEWLEANTERHDAKIWNQWTPTQVYDAKMTEPFNAFFGREVRLVYKPPFSTEPRALRSNGASEVLGRAASTCFPDLMPLLVGSEASISELNSGSAPPRTTTWNSTLRASGPISSCAGMRPRRGMRIGGRLYVLWVERGRVAWSRSWMSRSGVQDARCLMWIPRRRKRISGSRGTR